MTKIAYANGRPGLTPDQLTTELKPVSKQQAKMPTLEEWRAAQARIAELEARQSIPEKPVTFSIAWEVSDGNGGRKEGKGGVKVSGLATRFPWTPYMSQMIRFLEVVPECVAFCAANVDNAAWKDGQKERYLPRLQKLVQMYCK